MANRETPLGSDHSKSVIALSVAIIILFLSWTSWHTLGGEHMGLGWLKRKVQVTQIKSATLDIERFNLGLRGAADDEVGATVALATLMRFRCYREALLPEGILGEDGDKKFALLAEARIQARPRLNSMIRELQKAGDPVSASGVMVWLHTLRAMTMPEIRLLGREMWGELSRGFPHAPDFLNQMDERGIEVPSEVYEEYGFIPPFLEPKRSEAAIDRSTTPVEDAPLAARPNQPEQIKISPKDVRINPSLTPTPDPVLTHLYEQAIEGQVPVFAAVIPLELVEPFDKEYDPRKSEEGAQVVAEVMSQWRRGIMRRIWVYPKGNKFIMSDDYMTYYAAINGQPDCVPCFVLGTPDNPRAIEVDGPATRDQVAKLLGMGG